MTQSLTAGELAARLQNLGLYTKKPPVGGGRRNLPSATANSRHLIFWNIPKTEGHTAWFGRLREDRTFSAVYNATLFFRGASQHIGRFRSAVNFFRATGAATSLAEISFFLDRLGLLRKDQEWTKPLFRTYREPYAEYLAAWDPKKRLFILGMHFDVSPLTWPEKRQSENSQKNGVPRST